MIKYRIINNNKIIEFDTLTKAEMYASENDIDRSNISEINESVPSNLMHIIESRIEYYQKIAPQLIRELYAQNTLMGITTQQSDQMFDEYSDVLIRLKEGAFPTALYRLSQKTPSGFVTQELIESWKDKIRSFL